MDSSFIVVAKTVMENRQMLAALIYALSKSSPEVYELYAEKLEELKKEHSKDFEKMDSVLQKLNSDPGSNGQQAS